MRVFGALILGVFTGLAISYTGPVLDWGFAVNAATPSSTGEAQWVDRSFKSDRLDMQSATRVGKQPVKVDEKLLVGCEPASSPLSKAHAAIPGRCST